MTYFVERDIKDASDVNDKHAGCLRREQCENMLHQRNPILLLLSGSVDICNKKGDVMATDHRHESRVIEMTHIRLGLPAICSGVGVLTFLDDLLRDFGPKLSGGTLTRRVDAAPNGINLILRDYLHGIVKMRPIARGGLVAMVEIPIQCHMDITTPIKHVSILHRWKKIDILF